jgi:hypothetical protein
LLSALLLAGACRRESDRGASGSQRPVPKGDAVWLTDAGAAGEPGLEDRVQRIGASALFLPAGELQFEGGRWTLEPDTPPPQPLTRVPIVLALRGGASLGAALASAEGDMKGAAAAIASGLAPALAASGPYGRVAGIHLDFPFTVASAAQGAALVAALHGSVPAPIFVSISLRESPSGEEARERFEPLAREADALAAFLFGMDARADPSAIDALRRPWWATFVTAGGGERTQSREAVSERYLDALSGNPRVDMENDLRLNDASYSAFLFTARQPVRLEGLALEPGDRVEFRVPALPEMLFQLGATLAGKRFALGRILVVQGPTEADRVLPLAAFEDVLLGRSLAPTVEVTARPVGKGSVLVEAVNRGPHASAVSRRSNWVEVDLAPARAADVQLGGFDRYEVYDASERPVTPGRATRVRLFETLIASNETITPARILTRGALPQGCCRYRLHWIAAAGPEVTTDWIAPPPPPTPTKAPTKRPRK